MNVFLSKKKNSQKQFLSAGEGEGPRTAVDSRRGGGGGGCLGVGVCVGVGGGGFTLQGSCLARASPVHLLHRSNCHRHLALI